MPSICSCGGFLYCINLIYEFNKVMEEKNYKWSGTFFKDFPYGMTADDVIKEVKKYGYQVTVDERGNLDCRKDPSILDENLLFIISPENLVREKVIFFEEEAVYGKEMEGVLPEYQERYLELVGIEMDIIGYRPTKEHGAIFFQSDKYSGQIQINLRDNKVSVEFSLAIND